LDTLVFLGTGDSLGVPRVYCDCPVCSEARGTGRNRRFRSSALVQTPEGDLLIDCGPDWTAQMEAIGKRTLSHALITHPHHDHIAGLPEWLDACRWTGQRGTVYAPAAVFATIRRQYPWLESRLDYVPNDEGMTFGGWSIRPWEVCHGKNGTSFAYLFEKNGFRWAYCSDAIRLTDEQKKPIHQLDLLVLGTNYYKEEADPASRSVYDMTEAAELIREVNPKFVLFTHMSYGVDIGAKYELPPNAELAVFGRKIMLS